MVRYWWRRRRRKNRTGSIVITIVIYGLFLYLTAGVLNISINKNVKQNIMGTVVKKMAVNDIGIIGYVSEKDKKIISDTNDNTALLIFGILSDPISEYNDKSVALNIADTKNVEFYIDSMDIGNYMDEETKDDETDIKMQNGSEDKKEGNDENAINNENEINSESGESESVLKEDGNRETGNSENDKKDTGDENNTEINQDGQKNEKTDVDGDSEKVTEKVSGIPLNKTKDIKVTDMTYEYLMKNFYTVVSSTTLNPDDIDAEKLMNIDMKLSTKNDKPQILIYHTHGQEGFADSVSGNPDTGIIGVGNYLVEILQKQYGYNVIHITDSFDYVNGIFDRSKAYDYAYEKIAGVLAENPSIEVVIDLHRDGVGEHTHLVTDINGKPTAQIMFFNGISRLNGIGEIGYLYNPYRTENLAMSLQMKVLAEEYFEGFTRRNYIQAYQYNLHMRPKSMLIEAGAQTNTFEEVKNAMEPLAAILNMCIGDAE